MERTPGETTAADPQATPPPDLSGQTLGEFHVLRCIGQGGMGQVYLAEQRSLQRKVALKIMRPDLASNLVALQRFKAEALAVARATHANIVQVFAIGEEAGHHYMALEYVEGRNLRDYLTKKGPPDLPLALNIMRQVAAALQRAGELGIIHRDIKPENILLTRKGEVKVADFGLSRVFAGEQPTVHLTQSGVTMGTPLYMSPEQVEGKPLDPRTDIYSFGATCYHLLAGHPPFRGGTAFEVAVKHVRDEPQPLAEIRPDLPAELCALVGRMMAKDPAQRPATGRDLLREFNRIRDGLPGAKPPASDADAPEEQINVEPVKPAAARRRGRKGWLVAGALAALGMAVLAGAMLGRSARNRDTPPMPLPAEEPPSEVASKTEKERVLKKTVLEYALSPNPASKRLGLQLAMDLTINYFEPNNWKLDEADQFFTELIESKTELRDYRTLGRLGKAMVLAFKNKPAESNKLFVELFGDKAAPPARMAFLKPQVRQLVAKALDFNAANESPEAPFPKGLEHLRKPPALPGIVRPSLGNALHPR